MSTSMIKKLVVFGATGQTGMSSVEAALKHGINNLTLFILSAIKFKYAM